MKLENSQNLQDHLKVFVELFEELAIIDDAIVEEERVIILLSSLPDGFSALINLMFLERSAYTKALLSRFGMDKANSVATPVDINADLVTTSDEVEECDKDLYQSAVGSLLY
ncbi:hypothetical protein FHG87_014219 [Trinorchestia longiramus]|nr:hypothetical protein FHG87_014219 [Trinorchestia longiramus]